MAAVRLDGPPTDQAESQESSRQHLQQLLSHACDFYDSMIPRLFIVLPTSTELSGDFGEFRLYFFCECGAHATANGDRKSQGIHLAQHRGYELDKPAEFLEKYRTYLLVTTNMVKDISNSDNGLASLRIVNKHVRENFVALVNKTIQYLQNDNRNLKVDRLITDPVFDGSVVLKGLELMQVASYLKFKDRGRILGNLYRTVSREGHVAWRCLDHHRAIHTESSAQRLHEAVEVNDGWYTEELGRVEVTIKSSTQAAQLFNALSTLQGIQELEVTLQWDVTMAEIQALANAVTRANVVRLGLRGTHLLKGPEADKANRHQRFNPIAQLASNGPVQYLEIKYFDDFFTLVDKPVFGSTSKLRAFYVSSCVTPESKFFGPFKNLLAHCPSLALVELRFDRGCPVSQTTSDVLDQVPNLEWLKLQHWTNVAFTTRVSNGQIQEMSATIDGGLKNVEADNITFFRQGFLSRLDVKYTHEAKEDRLIELLLSNPRLHTLRVGASYDNALSVIKLVTSTRSRLMRKKGGSCQLRRFDLMENGLNPFEEWQYADNGSWSVPGIQSFLTFKEKSPGFDMRTWIRSKNMPTVAQHNPVYELFREYGWSIVHLAATDSFEDYVAATMDDITSERGSQLETLLLYPFKLTDSGLRHLDRVIEKSRHLKRLKLSLPCLDKDDHAQKAQLLLRRYGSTLTELVFTSLTLGPSLLQVASSFPSRSVFPNLTSLTFIHTDKQNPFDGPADCVSWIATMISSPRQKLPTQGAAAEQQQQQQQQQGEEENPSGSGGPTGKGEKAIVSITLSGMKLQPNDWAKLIDTIDFFTVQDLIIYRTNFAQDQLERLVNRVPDHMADSISLRRLDTRKSDVATPYGSPPVEALLERLRKKVPSIVTIP
ncbi:hypothetical protein BGX31_000576 [Mortierella sp. GBA43]|nr:hypothetical protein BGX31_000576 [Mortierella sp. GBA43]